MLLAWTQKTEISGSVRLSQYVYARAICVFLCQMSVKVQI
jgi:hypothetical protein